MIITQENKSVWAMVVFACILVLYSKQLHQVLVVNKNYNKHNKGQRLCVKVK